MHYGLGKGGKNMKKTAALLLTAILLFSAASCSQDSGGKSSSGSPEQSSSNSTASSEASEEEISIADATFDYDKDYSDTLLAEYIEPKDITDKTKKDVLDVLTGEKMTLDVSGKLEISDGIYVSFSAALSKSGDDTYLKTEFGSDKSTVLKLGEDYYSLDDEKKTALIGTREDAENTVDTDPTANKIMKYFTNAFSFDNVKQKKNGVATFKDEKLIYEEYTSGEKGDSTVRLYYDGSTLKYIVSTKDKLESVITINSITSEADDSLFKVPEDYRIITEPESEDTSPAESSTEAYEES